MNGKTSLVEDVIVIARLSHRVLHISKNIYIYSQRPTLIENVGNFLAFFCVLHRCSVKGGCKTLKTFVRACLYKGPHLPLQIDLVDHQDSETYRFFLFKDFFTTPASNKFRQS
ncbi:hypothetical protein BDV23DRAFT_153729 [Aspergillus alliaceus]|uniref:Uncharacterized protein n=1 Tax=Petromyces alliaceus TaxID=209559 RepID=A0A5N7CAC8_PETAA|nr:hypothetical protein BDV23DRAFT_153729 [Aspergillus alliaceus]